MTKENLKILFVEDVATDYELMVRQLRANSIEFESLVVESEEDFRRAIQEFNPTLIISDYSLPLFSGLDALQIIKESNMEIPFIICTASINEATAVKCMKSGADDYIIKDHIKRLPYAINLLLEKQKTINEKVSVETELKIKTEELKNYFDFALDLFCIASLDGKFIKLNKEWENTLGYKLNELEGEYFMDFVHNDDKKETEKALNGLNMKKDIYDFVNRHKCKNGSYRWLQWRATNSDGIIYAAAHDITIQKMNETQLLDKEQSLSKLAKRLFEIREDERTKIARDLHDFLGQGLTSMKMDIMSLFNKLESNELDSKILTKKKKSLNELIDKIIIWVRKLSVDLRPPLLEDFGLIATLETYISELNDRTDIEFIFSTELENININDKAAIASYRIYQEVLTNVIRHAEASKVNVNVSKDEGNYIIEIIDNGKGFDLSKLNTNNALGILGMRERAESFNGLIDIDSKKQSGTIVKIFIPV